MNLAVLNTRVGLYPPSFSVAILSLINPALTVAERNRPPLRAHVKRILLCAFPPLRPRTSEDSERAAL